MTHDRDTKGRFLPRVRIVPDEHDPEYSQARRWDDDMGYYPLPKLSIWRRIRAWLGMW
jgi:hypothetical protein